MTSGWCNTALTCQIGIREIGVLGFSCKEHLMLEKANDDVRMTAFKDYLRRAK